MILQGSQRGRASSLAAHLLNTRDNDHVEVHELRGFIANDLHGALQEIHAQSLGTRCQQYMFSLSLSPPKGESVAPEVFEKALERIEDKLSLSGQPRAVIFHEKDGRRHAHCVWSRIDVQRMRSINLPHFKMKLQDVSRELYRDYGWEMPRGFVNKQERSPLSYSLAEWQQAKRAQEDPKALKAMFQGCWNRSDNARAFAHALRDKGFILAKGDRRGFVAVDYRGEAYALSRWTGVKARELKARLGAEQSLPSVDQAKEQMAKLMTERLKTYIRQVRQASLQRQSGLKTRIVEMVQQHRQERQRLHSIQDSRWQQESKQRLERLPKGWRRIWSFVSGQTQIIAQRNAQEVQQCQQRDAMQRQGLIDRQRGERQALQAELVALRAEHQKQMDDLRGYLSRYAGMTQTREGDLQRTFHRSAMLQQEEAEQENLFDRGRELKRELSR